MHIFLCWLEQGDIIKHWIVGVWGSVMPHIGYAASIPSVPTS